MNEKSQREKWDQLNVRDQSRDWWKEDRFKKTCPVTGERMTGIKKPVLWQIPKLLKQDRYKRTCLVTRPEIIETGPVQ